MRSYCVRKKNSLIFFVRCKWFIFFFSTNMQLIAGERDRATCRCQRKVRRAVGKAHVGSRGCQASTDRCRCRSRCNSRRSRCCSSRTLSFDCFFDFHSSFHYSNRHTRRANRRWRQFEHRWRSARRSWRPSNRVPSPPRLRMPMHRANAPIFDLT